MTRRGRSTRKALLVAAGLLLSLPALADPAIDVPVRSGSHPDYGRVVFDAPPQTSYRVTRDGDRLTIMFGDGVALQGNPRLPRNVSALQAGGSQATLTIARGSTFHAARVGGHVVIDVFDPGSAAGDGAPQDPPPPAQRLPSTQRAPPAAEPPTDLPLPPPPPELATASTPPPSTPAPGTPPSPGAAIDRASPGIVAGGPGPAGTGSPDTPPAATQAAANAPAIAAGIAGAGPPADAAATVASQPQPPDPALVAQSVPTPPDASGSAFSLPFPADTGAAMVSRHGETLVVFDQRRQLDLTALQSLPPFSTMRAEQLPAATVLHLTPPPGTLIALSRTPPGWTIAALSKAPHLRPVAAQFGATAVSLAAQSPGKVVSITDPDSGGMLLVGTELQPGQGVPILTRTPQFDLLPTGQGVAVSPRADSVALQAVPDGFVLTTAPAPLAVSRLDTDLLGDADALTRRFDFPALPAEQLTEQLAKHIAAAAALPPLARGPQRRAAALTMISLGMDAEAEALLQVTAGDDPREAESADVAGLTGIAALLAGRPAEAAGIDDPRLTGTDEILLWRALRVAILNPGSPQAAAALAATAPLLLTYPPAIRDKILPLAAETMVQGGATAAARELLAHAKGLPGLGLAQAMLSQASGNTGDALARYDTLAASRDAFVSARAARRAVELRLATGKLDKRQAAEALDRLLYAWRGDRRELALREELAKLREQLGEWHQALIMLRDSETLFPDDAKAIHAQLQQAFEAGLQGGAADELPPLEFVALVDENADLIPNTGKGTAIEEKLADRLLALDLPEKAGPVLDKLMHAEPAGAVRAGLGLRLAALRLRDGDIDGALAAMNGSDAPDLPAPMNLQRTILRADAQARSGDVPGAIALLSKLDSVAAAGERATILERAKDWPGADRALADYVARTVPEAGDLTDDARRSLLRLATAAARAGDETTLAALRDRDQARMGTGPLADMFRLLTTEPVHGAADLSRSAREVGLAKALPSALQAMQPQVRTP